MSTNTERADWSGAAAEKYCELTRSANYGRINKEEVSEVLGDLIGDLGHYAERMGLSREEYIECVSHGVGMWSAERRAPLIEEVGNEPGRNDLVEITVDELPMMATEEGFE